VTDEDLLSLASASDSRQARVRALRERIDNQPAAAIMVDREALLELLSPPPVTRTATVMTTSATPSATRRRCWRSTA